MLHQLSYTLSDGTRYLTQQQLMNLSNAVNYAPLQPVQTITLQGSANLRPGLGEWSSPTIVVALHSGPMLLFQGSNSSFRAQNSSFSAKNSSFRVQNSSFRAKLFIKWLNFDQDPNSSQGPTFTQGLNSSFMGLLFISFRPKPLHCGSKLFIQGPKFRVPIFSFRASQPQKQLLLKNNAHCLLLPVVTSQTPSLAASLQCSSHSVVAPVLSSAVAMANQAGRLNTSVVVAMDPSRLASLAMPQNFAAGDGECSLTSLIAHNE